MKKGYRARHKALAGAVLLLGSAWAHGSDVSTSWTSSNSGSWTDSTKWASHPNYPRNTGTTYDALINANVSVTLDAPITINSLDFRNGTLTGPNTLTLQQASFWRGGNLINLSLLKVNSSLEISDQPRQFALSTIEIDSVATVTWLGGSIDASDENGGGGIINNAGLIDDQTDDWWTWGNVLTPVLNNTGEYRKSAGSSESNKSVWAVFNNSGFVDVQTSDLWFTGGGHNTGSFSVAADARLMFSDYNQGFSGAGSPTTTFSSAAVINSLGTVIFANDFGHGTTTFAGTYDSAFTVINTDDANQPGNDGRITFLSGASVNTNLSGGLRVKSGVVDFQSGQAPGVGFTNVYLEGGEIAASDELFFDTLDWTRGTIRGNTANNVSTGSLAFIGTDTKQLIDISFFNGIASHATISEGALTMTNARIVNLSGGTFDFQGGATLTNDDPFNFPARFYNSGMLVKSAGADVAYLDGVELFNSGTVQVQSGFLLLNGGGTHIGTFLIDPGATLKFGHGATFNPHYLDNGAYVFGDSNSELMILGQTVFNLGSLAELDKLEVYDFMDIQSAVKAMTQTNVHTVGQIDYNAGVFEAGHLALFEGGDVNFSAGGGKTMVAKSIAIDTVNNSKIDMSDNKAIVDYDSEDPSPINSMRQLIHTGYNNGLWNADAGLTTSQGSSTRGLGYAENSVLDLDNFGGYAVDDDAILIKYTYMGDANLDGLVDIRDLRMFAASFGDAGSFHWTDGDFDYDGDVDRVDLQFLARNWQAGVGAPLADALASLDLPETSIPEPVGLVAAAALTWPLKRPRRRVWIYDCGRRDTPVDLPSL